MKGMGLEDRIVRWIENWLLNRRQRVVVNDVASGWERVESGVPQPQGSVLRPVLFIIFIDDLNEGLVSRILEFADDTKLISEEEVDRLREDLRILFKWSEDWPMAFNVDKVSVIHFGFNNNLILFIYFQIAKQQDMQDNHSVYIYNLKDQQGRNRKTSSWPNYSARSK